MESKEKIISCLDRVEYELWNAICENSKVNLLPLDKNVLEISLSNCRNLINDLIKYIREEA